MKLKSIYLSILRNRCSCGTRFSINTVSHFCSLAVFSLIIYDKAFSFITLYLLRYLLRFIELIAVFSLSFLNKNKAPNRCLKRLFGALSEACTDILSVGFCFNNKNQTVNNSAVPVSTSYLPDVCTPCIISNLLRSINILNHK